MGSVIKMYSTGTSAQIDVPMNGSIVGVEFAIHADNDTDADYWQTQLSFRSTAAYTTNDDRAIIAEARQQFQLVTSGAVMTGFNGYIALPDVPVAAGERLYLHVDSTGGVTVACACLIHFSFDMSKMSSRRL